MYDYIRIMKDKKLCRFESPIRSNTDRLTGVRFSHKCNEFNYTDSVKGVFPKCTPVTGYVRSMSAIMTLLDLEEYKPNNLGSIFYHPYLTEWNSSMWELCGEEIPDLEKVKSGFYSRKLDLYFESDWITFKEDKSYEQKKTM